MSIMDAMHMEAQMDCTSPEVIMLACEGSMEEALALVANQRAMTEHVLTRDCIEGSARYSINKADIQPSGCEVSFFHDGNLVGGLFA
jgi:hypothetical protein